MTLADPRLLILGAHPDDAEFHAGGLATLYRSLGYPVKLVSVTDGGAGHHQKSRATLIETRRDEAAASGEIIGAPYVTWDFPDGHLVNSRELRDQIIREIRTYQPDLVLTHRVCDYHPDHRAVGQAVQDASYLVTVPLVVPEVAHLPADPVVAYMADLFTRPYPLQPDILLDIEPLLPTIVKMLACHRSQVFEFLPYNLGSTVEVPDDENAKIAWLTDWFTAHIHPRAAHFRNALVDQYGPSRGAAIRWVEAFEISEYASALDSEARQRLFPIPSV